MKNNWTIEQTKKLFGLAYTATSENKGLNWAFNKVSTDTGRSINSVRNYYYAQTKMFEIVPKLAEDLGIKIINSNRSDFEMFSKDEIDNLVKTILKEKAKGKSVRATIARLSKGDEKLALRLQNKYRSMIGNHKSKVIGLMEQMNLADEIYFNPYTKKLNTECEVDNHKKLVDFVANLDESEAEKFLDLMQKVFA